MGVALIGILLPLALHWLPRRREGLAPLLASLLASLLALAGGLVLRAVIVFSSEAQ